MGLLLFNSLLGLAGQQERKAILWVQGMWVSFLMSTATPGGQDWNLEALTEELSVLAH